ncbi:hypothetical protein K435DRAFT_872841 [Dendrothele bispora CBS 962.96]|uniref:Uncharacterized protein n=1 Tax=Dendrothele bispora (strain CBS 962.96) TaxID=1314807 RepID=A0A4S8L0K7_DENBC|nr:hypothetical protein K435DRAFT_872841 [Dendrothele bispora CBS 962.96]
MPERDPSFQHNPAVDSPPSFSFSTAQPETCPRSLSPVLSSSGLLALLILTFADLTGAVVFSLAISVTIHPLLFTQIVLMSIITPISPSSSVPLWNNSNVPPFDWLLVWIGHIDNAISPYTRVGKRSVEVLVKVEFGVGRERKNVGLMPVSFCFPWPG